MFCRYCGKENSDDANFCNSCGKSLSGKSTPNNTQQPAPARPAAEPTANLAIASLIFGICSIPMAFLALWLSLLCAICAVVLGKISLDQKRPGKEYAEWGIKLGAIGFGICVAFFIIYIVSIFGLFAFMADMIPSIS
ncbi:zinc-ribbon domain-containing protein [Ruminococcus flavefaciens]|uniref:Zinc-ribbon domain-containing protein n=1 Tax=Ruminococcus flavefaciens TaxID=1265 RepID=A0A1M7LBA2_RUMFL|nr:zinc-ribbon domain-containing protein [Ruminococcus flavefaciens]SHM75260.1 zinc-ribbon domain-containing protein [Ruminococcus flavefaciens]